MKVIHSRAI